ncbi:conserved protein of unknown function (plasmid) [Rhodovastum atsumiense]|uniref:Uncharacterized protein n=1 Tax=Rhodovastum atsumiense TaxID=504468 RepID=A0A5M6IP62_9PROT|nr:hypothetical protein [Rhodovastum atsumiense]KAA5609689.1 hypothetical protein F1189_23300 [Rhodovastum atsumiense]CAH2606465.1 conserved protein of unknown function [Rhodovastum atsumiense]
MTKSLVELVNEVEGTRSALADHEAQAAAVSRQLRTRIGELQTEIRCLEAGIDLAKVALAETVLYVHGEFDRAGEDRDGARQDAINWFAACQPATGYGSLRHEYFGTKSYDRWRGQRSNHEYGYGPRHGSIIFEIGLLASARKRDLTADEREAAVYYLVHLSAIQAAAKAAKQGAA